MDQNTLNSINTIQTALVDIYVRLGETPETAIRKAFFPLDYADTIAGIGIDELRRKAESVLKESLKEKVDEATKNSSLTKEEKEKVRSIIEQALDSVDTSNLTDKSISKFKSDLKKELDDEFSNREKKTPTPDDIGDYFKIIDKLTND